MSGSGAVLLVVAVIVGLCLAYGWAWVDLMVGSWWGWLIVVVIVVGALLLGHGQAT